MISSVGSLSTAFPPRLAELNSTRPTTGSASGVDPTSLLDTSALQRSNEVPGLNAISPASAPTTVQPSTGPSFSDVLTSAVQGVNTKMQSAEVEKAKVMSGETNNLHQAMLSIQEASVAFSMMTEVRNKLVESYQEVMRMQV